MDKKVAQIFLSYAHLDNIRPQGFQMGWVDRIFDALNVEVPTHGIDVYFWRDRRDLEPESYLDERSLNAAAHSDAFVAILSPAYPQRPFCLKELTHFLNESKIDIAKERGNRVLKVVKRPIVDPASQESFPNRLMAPANSVSIPSTGKRTMFLCSFDPMGTSLRKNSGMPSSSSQIRSSAPYVRPRSSQPRSGAARALCNFGAPIRQPHRIYARRPHGLPSRHVANVSTAETVRLIQSPRRRGRAAPAVR